jgi:hypothetical protein
MRATLFSALLLAAGCTAANPDQTPGGGLGGGGSTTDDAGGNSPDHSRPDGGAGDLGGGTITGGGNGLLKFAVFGDARPPNQNDTAGYPSQIIGGIFAGAQSHGAQFVVGTGDYMFAGTQSAVDAQVALFLQAQANFQGAVYHTLGNHECNGYTSSNCPNGNETPNIQAFMSKLLPSGLSSPYYRVDVMTPLGKAKFLFIAANAWTTAQEAWLSQQLGDATMYTFVMRHEPPGETQAPGVSASDALIKSNKPTLALYGHTHEYRKLAINSVISGNGGAPLASGGGSNYGYLTVEQGSDGNLTISEVDESSGNVTDSWKVTPQGTAAP